MGMSETTIGNKGLGKEFTVDTKAATGVMRGMAEEDKVLQFAKESLDALKLNKVR